MRTKIIIVVIILNIVLLIAAAILYVYPSNFYSSYQKTSAVDRSLAYFFKPQQFTFQLLNSSTDHILTMKNSTSSFQANLFQFDSQSIDTMFSGWLRNPQAPDLYVIIPPSNCQYLRVNISLNISERYSKLNDFDPNGPIQNNGVLKSLYCVDKTEDLENF